MKEYFGLFLGLFGSFLSIYLLAQGANVIFNCFLLAVNLCVIVFWIKEIYNEKK